MHMVMRESYSTVNAAVAILYIYQKVSLNKSIGYQLALGILLSENQLFIV